MNYMKPSVLHLLAFTGELIPLVYGQESTDTTRNRPVITATTSHSPPFVKSSEVSVEYYQE